MGCEMCKEADRAGDGSSITAVSVSSAERGTLSFLAKVKLFQRLPPEDQSILAAACGNTEFPKGHVLMKEGDPGNEFFVICSGQVSVSKDGKEITSLSVGDYFGENALLRNEPRTATITANTPVKALTLTRAKFRELGLNEKLDFKKRQAVGGGADIIPKTNPPSTKDTAERKLIIDALKANANLATFCELDDAKCNELVNVAWTETVPKGQSIIQEGDLEADYFYIVKDGAFTVIKGGDDGGSSANDAVSRASVANTGNIGVIERGGSFGELALLYFAPRAATVQAMMNSVVFVIDRINFKNIMSKSAADVSPDFIQYLEKVQLLDSLLPDEKQEVAKALVEMSFSQGETIFEQGEKGQTFYILYEGTVSVAKSGKEVATLQGTPKKAEIFGEMALLNDAARTATIKVTSSTAKALCLDKESFDMLLGPLEEIKQRGKSGQSKVGKGKKKQTVKKAASDKILRKDLDRVGLLGCGGFGTVELVEHVKTKETYALKALSKGYIVKCGMKKGVMSEKNIQSMCDSPFIVKLYETYNGEQSLYFLLELALGGELFATYSMKGLHGSEKHCKFYVAGTVFAFEHLHERKIIFRDLKSENLLLTEEGKVKLTDMGLAKVCVGKTFTTCGTPDYFAPELISQQGHTNAVDWWTLGILTFELMAGHAPFEAPNPMQIYSKVSKGIGKVTFPQELAGNGEDLVKKLCTKNPTDRLPMKKGGTSRIKQHAWFKEFDWDSMKNLTMEPPYKPKVGNKKDLANFNARKEDMPPQVKYTDDGSGWDKDFASSS